MQENQKKLKAPEQLRQLSAELEHDFSELLKEELSQLEMLSRFTESIAEKLQKQYAAIFPKKCNNCGTIYETRQAFLKDTKRLAKTTTIFDEIGLQEYRNCPCGSTLVIWSKDRRDRSQYGQARRELFDQCLKKLKELSQKPEKLLRRELRQIFYKASL